MIVDIDNNDGGNDHEDYSKLINQWNLVKVTAMKEIHNWDNLIKSDSSDSLYQELVQIL